MNFITIINALKNCFSRDSQPSNAPLLISATYGPPAKAFFDEEPALDTRGPIEAFKLSLSKLIKSLLLYAQTQELDDHLGKILRSLYISEKQLSYYETKNKQLALKIKAYEHEIENIKAKNADKLLELEAFQEALRYNAKKMMQETDTDKIRTLIKPFAYLFEKDADEFNANIRRWFGVGEVYPSTKSVKQNTQVLINQRTLDSFRSNKLYDVRQGAFEILDYLSKKFAKMQHYLIDFESINRQIDSCQAAIIDPNIVITNVLKFVNDLHAVFEDENRPSQFLVASRIKRNIHELVDIAAQLENTELKMERRMR